MLACLKGSPFSKQNGSRVLTRSFPQYWQKFAFLNRIGFEYFYPNQAIIIRTRLKACICVTFVLLVLALRKVKHRPRHPNVIKNTLLMRSEIFKRTDLRLVEAKSTVNLAVCEYF